MNFLAVPSHTEETREGLGPFPSFLLPRNCSKLNTFTLPGKAFSGEWILTSQKEGLPLRHGVDHCAAQVATCGPPSLLPKLTADSACNSPTTLKHSTDSMACTEYMPGVWLSHLSFPTSISLLLLSRYMDKTRGGKRRREATCV